MARVFIPIKFIKAFYHTGSQRVKVNIAREFSQVRIFLAKYGLITILEKVAVAAMPFVEADRIAGPQAPHDAAQWHDAGSQ